jgi:hypothetical protein
MSGGVDPRGAIASKLVGSRGKVPWPPPDQLIAQLQRRRGEIGRSLVWGLPKVRAIESRSKLNEPLVGGDVLTLMSIVAGG